MYHRVNDGPLVKGWPRQVPVASDRDRIAAARYAAERLAVRMVTISRKRYTVWSHYSDSAGGVVSVNQ